MIIVIIKVMFNRGSCWLTQVTTQSDSHEQQRRVILVFLSTCRTRDAISPVWDRYFAHGRAMAREIHKVAVGWGVAAPGGLKKI